MKKIAFVLAVSSASLMSAAANAGGWGGSSGGLVNISPTVDVGNVAALNHVLNGNVIGSGNVVSGLLGGNSIGILNGNRTGILGGYKLRGRH